MESLSYAQTNDLMVGSVPFYERHVFLCHKGPANWPENPFSFEWDCMPRRMRMEMKTREEETQRRAMFTVCEGKDVPGSYNGDILVFPDMLIYKSLTRFDVECFVNEAVVEEQPRYLWPEPLTGCHIFVCCQVTRDSLCGAIGPRVVARFREEIQRRKLVDVHVWPCCHLSSDSHGSSCCGNVAIFKRTKPSCGSCGKRRSEGQRSSVDLRQQQQLSPEALAAVVAAASAGRSGEVRGDWYGQVMPDDVGDIVELHVAGGDVVERLWRGRMGSWPEQQLNEQRDRLTSLRCVSSTVSGSCSAPGSADLCSCTAKAVSRASSLSQETSARAVAGRKDVHSGTSAPEKRVVAFSPSSTLEVSNRMHGSCLESCSSGSSSTISDLPSEDVAVNSGPASPTAVTAVSSSASGVASGNTDVTTVSSNSPESVSGSGSVGRASSPYLSPSPSCDAAVIPAQHQQLQGGGRVLTPEQQRLKQQRLEAHLDPWLLEEKLIRQKEMVGSSGKFWWWLKSCCDERFHWSEVSLKPSWVVAGSAVAVISVAALAAMRLAKKTE
eukprot:TRINITY_DN17377_c0_g1_i1.p1 TRINITY_DN17377_c0_g1~~TRINITY_DN17377_c0_g1_i1.p1  ORF type:complete len:638 (-),score=2.34 TRINITY_DN17377_c0_g1_i1:183-1838(-)